MQLLMMTPIESSEKYKTIFKRYTGLHVITLWEHKYEEKQLLRFVSKAPRLLLLDFRDSGVEDHPI